MIPINVTTFSILKNLQIAHSLKTNAIKIFASNIPQDICRTSRTRGTPILNFSDLRTEKTNVSVVKCGRDGHQCSLRSKFLLSQSVLHPDHPTASPLPAQLELRGKYHVGKSFCFFFDFLPKPFQRRGWQFYRIDGTTYVCLSGSILSISHSSHIPRISTFHETKYKLN